MVPNDEFTPYGYLDNPYHSWKLNPNGVLRSRPPLGMGWHVPNLGSYVRNQFQYMAHLSIGLKIGSMVLLTPEDFKHNKCTIVSQLHTKNRFEYTLTVPKQQLTLTARFFLVNADALGCVLTFSTSASQALPITCFLMHQHTHNPHTSRLWEHGLYMIPGEQEGTAMLGIASEGDVFTHGLRAADATELRFEAQGYTSTLEDAAIWAHGMEVSRPNITEASEGTSWQSRVVIVPCTFTLTGTIGNSGAPVQHIINAVLARGVSQDQSYQRWLDGIEVIARAEADQRSDDEAFWSYAPQLSGDWPAHWRRGLVYDFETLRMTVRAPIGVIPHFWDGMQIQAPRTVLAEAAMDALFLSYADPKLAGDMILGHFEAAPQPQLPCMREDGSYNMVADDGQICGTAPEWGFPLWCCDLLFRRSGDLHWLRRLYPGAAAYLRWWLDHRRDPEGWLVYTVSWESGQDVSSRFGPQQTGGTIIEHVRPVDLQASMVQSAEILMRWAVLLEEAKIPAEVELDFNAEARWWEKIASEFTVKTRQMWQNGWFRDYDSVTQEWSTQQDAMHLAPVFCGAAGWGHIEQLRSFLAQPPMHSSGWAPLSWPPVVMTLVGAASAAQMPQDAAELAYRFIDASYRSTDSREPDEHGGLPGVTREYRRTITSGKWGATEYVNGGIEGYGWGALSIHLLMRYILGLHEVDAAKISVAPVLPQALRKAGATYRAEPIPWGTYKLAIAITVRDAEGYKARMTCTTSIRPTIEDIIDEIDLEPQQEPEPRVYTWEGKWGEERTFTLSV